jgi:hypothetical protein
MDNAKPIFDPGTHYRIEVRGQVDVDWLRSFEGLEDSIIGEKRQREDITVLNIHTDQSGIVGLVRRLHGLGITILSFEMVMQKET